LIEALGLVVLPQARRLAVLSVDPSSPQSGGSLLGDQTRMPSLSARDDVFIRPSPARDQLGGLGPGTETKIALCEWALFDPIFVETVGVGQNEVEVRELVDWVVLVIPPDAGDDVSGMKRGITESCDFLVVNKVDLSPERAAVTRDQYRDAMALLGRTVVVPSLVSATHRTGIKELWAAITEAHRDSQRINASADRRDAQRRSRLRRAVLRRFEASLREPERAALLARAEEQMLDQGLSADEAAVPATA
jgi:LAO/AO transport system kinase